MTDRQELYEELLPLLIEPSGDPIRDGKPYPHGRDDRVWSFCPAHSDGSKSHRRSLSLSPRFGLDCFAGCDFQAIVRALRDRAPSYLKDNVREFKRPHTAPVGHPARRDGKLVAEWTYTDAAGVPVAVKGRFEFANADGSRSKSFSWRLPNAKDWATGLGGLRMADVPLYQAKLLAEAEVGAEVWIVEGEKAADSILTRGEIATSHPGGASTKDFGSWIERLFEGKRFRLRWWADNDDVGRDFMARFRLATLPFCDQKRSFEVRADVPHKGDAFDYLAAGGDLDKLREGVVVEPLVQYVGESDITIVIPCGDRVAYFEFFAIEKTARSLECELTVRIDKPGTDPEDFPFSQRLNLLSGSSVTDTRRTIEAIYGKLPDASGGWAKVINQAISLCRKGYASIDRSRDAAEAEAVEIEPSWWLEPYFHAGQFAIAFGDGEAAKSMTILRMSVCAALGEEFLPGLGVAVGAGLYGDWETNFEDWGRRLKRVVRGLGYPQMPPGLLHYWPGNGVPLFDQVEAIAEKCVRDRLGFFICDSLGMACGDEPEKAEFAIKTANAVSKLTKLGITVIGVAHVTGEAAKEGNARRPFGSVFWNNAARRTLYVIRSNAVDQDVAYQAWFPRKVNNGRRPRPLGLTIEFQGEAGPITFARDEVKRIPDLAERRSWRTQIWDVLADGAKPIYAIAEALGISTDEKDKIASIAKALNGGARGERPTFVKIRSSDPHEPDQWGRAERTG